MTNRYPANFPLSAFKDVFILWTARYLGSWNRSEKKIYIWFWKHMRYICSLIRYCFIWTQYYSTYTWWRISRMKLGNIYFCGNTYLKRSIFASYFWFFFFRVRAKATILHYFRHRRYTYIKKSFVNYWCYHRVISGENWWMCSSLIRNDE